MPTGPKGQKRPADVIGEEREGGWHVFVLFAERPRARKDLWNRFEDWKPKAGSSQAILVAETQPPVPPKDPRRDASMRFASE